jgi:hypothetical protein
MIRAEEGAELMVLTRFGVVPTVAGTRITTSRQSAKLAQEIASQIIIRSFD